MHSPLICWLMKGFELSSLNLHGKAPSEGAMWTFQVLRSGADVTGSILWGKGGLL